MLELADILARFDRKERNWLIRDILGQGAKTLDRDFLRRIESSIRKKDKDFTIDNPLWWAIDYHIDWLAAALHAFGTGDPNWEDTYLKPDFAPDNGGRLITGNQQDIDLVIASGSTLILIEAKGVGGWGNEGFRQKIERLKNLSHHLPILDDGKCGTVTVRFLLCSPDLSERGDDTPWSNVSSWPRWMLHESPREPRTLQPLYVSMEVKSKLKFLTVSRFDKIKEEKDINGKEWKILPTNYKYVVTG